jgi:hypothetical protein
MAETKTTSRHHGKGHARSPVHVQYRQTTDIQVTLATKMCWHRCRPTGNTDPTPWNAHAFR